MINLMIAEAYENLVDAAALERAALAALAHQQAAQEIDPSEETTFSAEDDLSIVLEDDTRLHELNKSFLEIDAPTDVLSFPSGEDEADPETGHYYLGDIIISYPRAAEQAAAAGHAVMDELQLLVVHGVLHLLGHDHAEAEEKASMWAAQREILDLLGVRLSRLPD